MSYVRISKEFNFEMAHALMGYDGKCAFIHGHSYRLVVTLLGKPKTGTGNPKLGMVMDFSDLKRIVNDEVVGHLDHALVLNEADERATQFATSENLVLAPYQPTCENLLLDIVAKLQPALAGYGKLHSVVLHETSTSKASWHAADNV